MCKNSQRFIFTCGISLTVSLCTGFCRHVFGFQRHVQDMSLLSRHVATDMSFQETYLHKTCLFGDMSYPPNLVFETCPQLEWRHVFRHRKFHKKTSLFGDMSCLPELIFEICLEILKMCPTVILQNNIQKHG